jgi:hypothetical protein
MRAVVMAEQRDEEQRRYADDDELDDIGHSAIEAAHRCPVAEEEAALRAIEQPARP